MEFFIGNRMNEAKLLGVEKLVRIGLKLSKDVRRKLTEKRVMDAVEWVAEDGGV